MGSKIIYQNVIFRAKNSFAGGMRWLRILCRKWMGCPMLRDLSEGKLGNHVRAN